MADTQKKLLFIEPDESAREIFSAVLKPEIHGWELEFAATGAGALELNELKSFDIVISASQLPDQTGNEFFDTLKDRSPETIRFLLIEESEIDRYRSLVGSAQQVLVKPLGLRVFTRQVNRAFALRKIINDPAILKLLGGTESLPSLPRVFHELCQKLNDPNASLVDVADIISQDIVLSSKVLKVVNSALFSLRTPASDIAHAVSLLGSSAISALVFSQGMSDAFKSETVSERFIEELNHHCIECANLAGKILSNWEAGRAIVDKVIFCGIAHDLGKLVLAKYAPEKWKEVQIELEKGDQPDFEIERAIIGVSHCEITAYLLAIWGFPNDQIMAIVFHHEPSRISEQEFGLLCALHLAENCCESSLQKECFDWDYLDECRIPREDVEGLKALHVEEMEK